MTEGSCVTKDNMFYELEPADKLQIAGNLLVKNQKTNKAMAIQREIGHVPVLAFGNSTGDFSIATYTLQNKEYDGRAYMLLCDDVDCDYGDPEAAAAFKEKCDARCGRLCVVLVGAVEAGHGSGHFARLVQRGHARLEADRVRTWAGDVELLHELEISHAEKGMSLGIKSGACTYNVTVRQADSAPTWVRNERKDDGMDFSTNGISPELAKKLKAIETEKDLETLAEEEGLNLSDKQLEGIAGGRIEEKNMKCFATHHC